MNKFRASLVRSVQVYVKYKIKGQFYNYIKIKSVLNNYKFKGVVFYSMKIPRLVFTINIKVSNIIFKIFFIKTVYTVNSVLTATSMFIASLARVVYHAEVAVKMKVKDQDETEDPEHKLFSCCGNVTVEKDMNAVCVLKASKIFHIENYACGI